MGHHEETPPEQQATQRRAMAYRLLIGAHRHSDGQPWQDANVQQSSQATTHATKLLACKTTLATVVGWRPCKGEA
jgi:hypothetical protein